MGTCWDLPTKGQTGKRFKVFLLDLGLAGRDSSEEDNSEPEEVALQQAAAEEPAAEEPAAAEPAAGSSAAALQRTSEKMIVFDHLTARF